MWIDGGLHANEVLGAQQLTETIYQLVSKNDPETLRFLRDVIILAVHVNPDGMELVSDWYMRNSDPLKRETNNLPRLYQKYIGHDNNRDFYMSAQNESINMNRAAVSRVVPADHLQPPPDGTDRHDPVRAAVPRSGNYVYHPLVITGLDVGRLSDAQPFRRREQARRDHAPRRQLLNVVERRPAHDRPTFTT